MEGYFSRLKWRASAVGLMLHGAGGACGGARRIAASLSRAPATSLDVRPARSGRLN